MTRIYAVRHAEVHNPTGVLYGRLPRFRLTDQGSEMANAVAQYFAGLRDDGMRFSAVYSSPLLRAQLSARPIAEALTLPLRFDSRLIEPSNRFEGQVVDGPSSVLRRPRSWRLLVNPIRPSWGEPYRSILRRMMSAMGDAHSANTAGSTADSIEGAVIMVSHQLPIWLVHRNVTGAQLHHNPAQRRCALSSVTVFEADGNNFTEVEYQEPAAAIASEAVDQGAA